MAARLATWLFGSRTEQHALREDEGRAPSQAATPDRSSGLPLAQAAGRRDRALDGGEHALRDGLAQKVFHGWLQNRHQTLFPLTVNIRSLDARQRTVLAHWMPVAMLAGRLPGDAEVADAMRWLGSVGADAATLDAFTWALENPPALSRILAAVAELDLSAYAYVVALVALDPLDPGGPPFLDYVAARLGLPTTVVRSATRRYRR